MKNKQFQISIIRNIYIILHLSLFYSGDLDTFPKTKKKKQLEITVRSVATVLTLVFNIVIFMGQILLLDITLSEQEKHQLSTDTHHGVLSTFPFLYSPA